jgi:hypothetical protein
MHPGFYMSVSGVTVNRKVVGDVTVNGIASAEDVVFRHEAALPPTEGDIRVCGINSFAVVCTAAAVEANIPACVLRKICTIKICK